MASGAMFGTAIASAWVRPSGVVALGAEFDLQSVVPKQFRDWTLDKVTAAFVRPANDLSQRMYQQLLERMYVDGSGRRVMLSMAYGRSQSDDLALHWPEVCYRYGGFTVYGKQHAQLPASQGAAPVTRLIAELPARPEPITYWAVLAGTRIGDSEEFRLRRLSHVVRREIPDGLLVRVSSIDPLADRAYALHAQFIEALLAALDPAARARIAGLPAGT
jgi:EpsI family protein